MDAFVARVRVLAKVKGDMAAVAERDRVITKSLQHDVREDVPVIAGGVVSRDVVESFDT